MKKISIIIGVAAILAITGIVSANSSFFLPNTPTAAATTSLSYMGIGTATTTLSYDSFQGGQYRATDKTAVLVQFVASSTSSVLGVDVQYSQDGIDWYSDNVNTATTSISQVLDTSNRYTWKASGTATSSKIFTISTPTRYFRAVFSMTGAAGGIWAQFVPQRQAIQ